MAAPPNEPEDTDVFARPKSSRGVSILVAAVLLERDGRTRTEIAARFAELVAEMEARGAHVHMPKAGLDYAVDFALRHLELRKLARREGGGWAVVAEDRALVTYYANTIAHLSAAIPAPEPQAVPGDSLDPIADAESGAT